MAYFRKRAARIYPGFVVCFVVCCFVVAPLGGVFPFRSMTDIARHLFECAVLAPPSAPGVFGGRPYAVLDGSMWTISYEFRCYFLVALLGVAGLLKRGVYALFAAGILLAVSPFATSLPNVQPTWLQYFVGATAEGVRLAAVFLTGTAFYIYRDSLRLTGRGAAVAGMCVVVGLFATRFAPIAVAVAGGYVILWGARAGGIGILSKINNDNDISYGAYPMRGR
jgi:peptidoglycan/LPS O-acetylase OafA/YrhL